MMTSQMSEESDIMHHLQIRIKQLTAKQFELDSTLSSLKNEKRRLEDFSQIDKKPSAEISPHYRYIYPLVEEIYFLELREKELKEQYNDKRLSLEARRLGQQSLSASFTKEEAVLKGWYEELQAISNAQSPVSTTSVESQDTPTVHNIVYNFRKDRDALIEDLAVTVLCQAVHVRLKIISTLPHLNIHVNLAQRAEMSLNCDNHIPGLEEFVLQSLEENSSVEAIVSKIGDYISSDMAPFVISIPMKKKKGKRKKKELAREDVGGVADL